jgi:hypothetical protein
MAYAIERTIWSCMVAPNQRLSLRVNCEEVYRVYIKDEAEGGEDELENTLDRARAQEIYDYYKNLP